jgi:hypothetical protein
MPHHLLDAANYQLTLLTLQTLLVGLGIILLGKVAPRRSQVVRSAKWEGLPAPGPDFQAGRREQNCNC